MRINQGKTKVTIFNTARLYDFMPRLSIGGNTNLEVVEQFKLLGVIFQSNLRWQANTDFVMQKSICPALDDQEAEGAWGKLYRNA